MNKNMEIHKSADLCECGLCVDCTEAAKHAKLMDEAGADGMEHNEMIHRHRIATNVCVVCTAGLEETDEEVALKANTYGMEALTEYEQCFLEGSGQGRCPECIESGFNATGTLSSEDEEVYCHACSVAGGADRAIYHKGPACGAATTPTMDAMARDTDSAGLCYGPKACDGRTFDILKPDCQACAADADAAQAFAMGPLDSANCCCGPKQCVGKVDDFSTDECCKCNGMKPVRLPLTAEEEHNLE